MKKEMKLKKAMPGQSSGQMEGERKCPKSVEKPRVWPGETKF